jgi:hypothetical protein
MQPARRQRAATVFQFQHLMGPEVPSGKRTEGLAGLREIPPYGNLESSPPEHSSAENGPRATGQARRFFARR